MKELSTALQDRSGQFSIKGICAKWGLEEHALKKYAQFVNPGIQVIPLKHSLWKSP